MPEYKVRKHIELVWKKIEADSAAEAKEIVKDMGEGTGDTVVSFEVKEKEAET